MISPPPRPNLQTRSHISQIWLYLSLIAQLRASPSLILSSFSDTRDTLLENFPTSEPAAPSFSSEITSTQSSRRTAALVLEPSSNLQNVLELPAFANAYQQWPPHSARHVTSPAFPAHPVGGGRLFRSERSFPRYSRLASRHSVHHASSPNSSAPSVSCGACGRVLPETEIALGFLTGPLEALNEALIGPEDAWAP